MLSCSEVFGLQPKITSRLVHRQNFEMPDIQKPVEELSVDGGKIRLRTAEGEPCTWQEYKGISLHSACVTGAFFQDNSALVEWVNNQPLDSPVTCLGDGHDGVWKIRARDCPKL